MGRDKAELKRGDQSMLDYCHQTLAQAGFEDIVISRNTGEGIADVVNELGPLGGIYSVVKQIQAKAVLIAPVDMPFLTASDLQILQTTGEREGRPVCFEDNYLPLYLPLGDQLITYLEQQLFHDGNLKLRGLIKAFDGLFLAHSQPSKLVNTNTPQQWQQSQQQLADKA
jgi:molybdopterin-guanine dinucleotide biosynthesis protein A